MAPRLPKSGAFAASVSEGVDSRSSSPPNSMSLKKTFSISSLTRRRSSKSKGSLFSDTNSQHNASTVVVGETDHDHGTVSPPLSQTHSILQIEADPFASTTSIRTTHTTMTRSVSTLVHRNDAKERRRSSSQKVNYADVEKALQLRDVEMLNRTRAERRLSEAHSEMVSIAARGERLSQQVEETRIAMESMQTKLAEMRAQLDQERIALASVEERAKMAEKAAKEEKLAADKVYNMYVSLAFEHTSLKMTLADMMVQAEEDLKAGAEAQVALSNDVAPANGICV